METTKMYNPEELRNEPIRIANVLRLLSKNGVKLPKSMTASELKKVISQLESRGLSIPSTPLKEMNQIEIRSLDTKLKPLLKDVYVSGIDDNGKPFKMSAEDIYLRTKHELQLDKFNREKS